MTSTNRRVMAQSSERKRNRQGSGFSEYLKHLNEMRDAMDELMNAIRF